MRTRIRRPPSLLPVVFLTVLLGLLDLFCWRGISSAVEAVEFDKPKTETDASFRLVDETGSPLTALGVDPSIDPPQIGLNPQAVVTEQNILLLFFHQSTAARQLWLLFSVVSLGLLVLLACLPRGSRTEEIFFPGCALIFVLFAYSHWTQLASLHQQRHILERILQHAAQQPNAPELFVQLGATVHVAPVETQTVIHVCLDVLVLTAILLLRLGWKQQAARSVLSSEKYT